MAVYRVLEDTAGRDGGESDSGERTYTRIFTVETTVPSDGPEVILNHDAIPQINSPYVPASGRPDIDAGCINVRCVATSSRTVWRVVASYSNRLQNPNEAIRSPELRKARYEWDTITQAFPTNTDYLGQPILNTASDPFDPALSEEDSWQLLRVTRNQKKYDSDFYLQYQGKINADKWNGKKRRQVKCRKIRATDFFEGGDWYWRVSYEFEIRRSRIPANNILMSTNLPVTGDTDDVSYAWVNWILNRGFRERGIFTPRIVESTRAIRDPYTKFPVMTPALLAANGLQLPFDGTPLYLGYETLVPIDFAELDISIPLDGRAD